MHHQGNSGGLGELIPQIRSFIQKKDISKDKELIGNLHAITACLSREGSMLREALAFIDGRLRGNEGAVLLFIISKTASEIGEFDLAIYCAERIPVETHRDKQLEAFAWASRYSRLIKDRDVVRRLRVLEGKDGVTDCQVVLKKCTRAFNSKLCTQHCSKLLKNLLERYGKGTMRSHTRSFLDERIWAYLHRIRAMIMFRT